MTVKINKQKDLTTSILNLEVVLPQYKSDYESALRKVNSSLVSGETCELTYREKTALNMYRQHEQLESQIRLMKEIYDKHYLNYLSAVEKRVLQAYNDELIPEYELTEEEKEGLAYLDTPEMRNFRR